MYKLNKNPFTNKIDTVQRLSDNACIPFDQANTDYQAFKSAVLEQQANSVIDNGDSFSIGSDQSILQDADGNTMTIEEAKAYVRTLP